MPCWATQDHLRTIVEIQDRYGSLFMDHRGRPNICAAFQLIKVLAQISRGMIIGLFVGELPPAAAAAAAAASARMARCHRPCQERGTERPTHPRLLRLLPACMLA